MDIYNIIEAVDQTIGKETERLYVLHRNMQVQSKKLYKKFSYILYSVKGNKKDKVLVYENIMRAPSEHIQEIWESEDKVFLTKLFIWIKDGKYKNEQLSDTDN